MKNNVVFAICGVISLALLASADEPQPVSIVRLLVKPQKCDGKRVVVVGFLGPEDEDRLFLHYQDYAHGLRKNGVRLKVTETLRKANREAGLHQYVLVRGTFHISDKDKDHGGGDGFLIVDDLKPWSKLDYPLRQSLQDLIQKPPIRKEKLFDKIKPRPKKE